MSDGQKSLRDGIRDSALIKNPVLFEAIGVAPVAAMAVSVKSAIMLAAFSCMELVVIELFACLALKKVKSYFRMPIYAVLGMGINVLLFLFFSYITPNETLSAGIFLPLLAVNSLIALHCERFAVKNTFKRTFVDAVSAAVGYAFVVLVVGLLREILGSGTVYSVSLHLPIQLKAFLMPFGGLILLAFFAAAAKLWMRKRYPDAHPEQAFRMQEIEQSHIGKFKSLLDEDFNLFDEESAPEAPEKEQRQRPKKEKTKKKRKVQPAAEKTAAVQTDAEVPRRTRPAAQEDYLRDFDDMLAELSAYREKQQKSQAETVENEPEKAEETQQEATEE